MSSSSAQPSTHEVYQHIYQQPEVQEQGQRYPQQAQEIIRLLKNLGIAPQARVLEIGAGVGHLHTVHQGYVGYEHSQAGVVRAQQIYGAKANVHQGDATQLPEADDSVDFIFTYATLEHIPQIDRAMSEILRILKPGGAAWLAPAWNCRPWTVKKLQQRPYASLSWNLKVEKALIPLREHLLFRLALALPQRLWREARLGIYGRVPLEWQALSPNFELLKTYPHIADDDAFVNMDAHAAMCWLISQKVRLLSHLTFWQRLFCRGEPILIQKPV